MKPLKFLVFSITLIESNVKNINIIQLLDNCFKNIPYQSKKVLADKKYTEYENILIPVYPTDIMINIQSEAEADSKYFALLSRIHSQFAYSNEELISLYNVLNAEPKLLEKDILKQMKIQFIRLANENAIGVSYCDGGSSKKNNVTGFGVVKLIGPKFSNIERECPSVFSELKQQEFYVSTYSEAFEGGSNNVGELSGLEYVCNNFSGNEIEVIVSDSEYALKSMREWIHGWKQNNYRTYAKKPIKNADQIKRLEALIESYKRSGKIICFQWTHGHADNAGNNLCDHLATKAMEGITNG